MSSTRCQASGCSRPSLDGKAHCLTHHKEQDNYTYGLDHDIKQKMDSKFDANKARAALTWISALSGMQNDGDVISSLKNGVALCQALNKIWPGTVKKISNSNMPFSQRENIVAYLEGCKTHGLKETDLFVTTNLFEGTNPVAVVDNILALGILAQANRSFSGPYINVSGGAVQIQSSSGAKPVVAVPPNFSQTPSYGAPVPKPAASSSSSSSDAPKFCGSCGAKRVGDAKFCAECGGKL